MYFECKMLYSLLVVFLIGYPSRICGDESPKVQIRDTTLIGLTRLVTGSSKPTYAFRGIYFAEPPTGPRRFAPPVTKKLPSGTYDATSYGPFCPQNMEMTSIVFPRPFPSQDLSEDCLHLDVYTPSLDPDANLAVMVYYPGGAFANGGGGYYDGLAYATFQDVVVVSANYRLGALGFLSTEDEAAFGNFGLLDQQMVLQWIHNHIQAFGGDPNRVTIFGESAGAVSVALHFQSTLSQGFFHRAISSSGVAHSPIMMSMNPRHVAQRLAEKLQCPTSPSRELVECLRSKSAKEIVAVDMADADIPTIPFSPVVDGFFVEEHPVVPLTTGRLPAGPELLIGVNNHEGGYSNLAHRMNMAHFEKMGAAGFRQFLKSEFQKFIPGDVTEVVESIEQLYGGPEGLRDEQALLQLTEVIGDSIYVAPALAMADARTATRGKVFFYEYQHRRACSLAPSWVRADHGDEEYSVFGFPFFEEKELGRLWFTPEEKDLSHIVMTYWANFAKTGDPNDDGNASASDLPYWPQYTLQDKDYMKLDVTCNAAKNLKPNKTRFWAHLMEAARTRSQRDEL